MEKISLYLFGYRRIIVGYENLSAVMSLLLKNRIIARFENNESFVIKESDFERFKKCVGDKFAYEYSDCKGLFGNIKGIKNKGGVYVGVAFSILIMIFSSLLVWDVRIEGNEQISDSKIASELYNQGLKIGAFWPSINRSGIETCLLNDFEEISWININRRGSVAYVSVKEKDAKKEEGKSEIPYKYSNIVAKCDSVIEEITVKRGRAMVKVGDVVKEGDILISGIIESGEEIGFCNAEGTVIGRCVDKIEVYVDRIYTKTTEKKAVLNELNIKIFDLNINIFKKYRNLGKGYDIIKDRWIASAPNGAKFPVFIEKSYVIECEKEEAIYSDSEIVALASRRLRAKTAAKLQNSDLVSVRSCGNFEKEGYRMFSELVYLYDIGVALAFNVE